MKTLEEILEEIHYNQTKEYYYGLNEVYNLKAYGVFKRKHDDQKFFIIGGVTKNNKKYIVMVAQPSITLKGDKENFYFFEPENLKHFNMEIEIYSRRKSLELLLRDTPIAFSKASEVVTNLLLKRKEELEVVIANKAEGTKEDRKSWNKELTDVSRSLKTFKII